MQLVHTSTESFQALLDSHKWLAMPPSLASRRAASASSDLGPSGGKQGEGAAAAAPTAALSAAAAVSPPYTLMEHTPLAVYTNGLLGALNELRHCAPLSLQDAVAAVVEVRGSIPGLGSSTCL